MREQDQYGNQSLAVIYLEHRARNMNREGFPFGRKNDSTSLEVDHGQRVIIGSSGSGLR